MGFFNRRQFITSVSALAAFAGFHGIGFGQIQGSIRRNVGRDALSRLGIDSFLPYVNTDFTFRLPRGTALLRLTDLSDSRPVDSPTRKLKQENFVLTFASRGRVTLQQGTYHVEHFALGSFDLFITQGAVTSSQRSYTAVINRVTI